MLVVWVDCQAITRRDHFVSFHVRILLHRPPTFKSESQARRDQSSFLNTSLNGCTEKHSLWETWKSSVAESTLHELSSVYRGIPTASNQIQMNILGMLSLCLEWRLCGRSLGPNATSFVRWCCTGGFVDSSKLIAGVLPKNLQRGQSS